MLVALTAPVEFEGPVAVTQSPIARLAAVTDSVVVTVVEDDSATVRSDGAAVVGVVDVDDPKRKPASLTPSTTIDDEPAETTFPETIAMLGRPVPAGKLRDGVVPLGNPPPPNGAPPRGKAPAPRPKPVLQVPEEDGCEIVTDRAVIVEPDVVPRAVTHEPAVMDATARRSVLEKRVAEVHVTVS